MHPILARGGRLALYLGFWIFVGGLLAELLVTQVQFDWPQATLVALPLALAYAFVCLSGWYVSWSMPLVVTSVARIVLTALTASIISSSVWLVAAASVDAGPGAARLAVDPVRVALPGWTRCSSASAFLLYLLSLAVSYLLAAFEQSREAERRALRGQVLARGSRAAAAARADRPAFPVQQPALDQRADRVGSSRGAADVPAAGRLSSREPCARRAGSDYA